MGLGACAIAFCGAVILGLSLVWVNIERVDLAYELQKMQAVLSRKEELRAKLEVERNNLVAPNRLRRIAREAGLHAAHSRQMRRMQAPITASSRPD